MTVPDQAPDRPATADGAYNFAYLDEQTKRMIRRALLKATAIPGYQVPFASREMPMPYGWGTGGVQVTAACLLPEDCLKVIDQGADDTTNAVSIRRFFQRTAGVETTEVTSEASIIQTRHRIPETELGEGQLLVYQVPIPEPLRFLEPRETETRKMHALEEYGLMHVKLYEDISQHGHISTAYAYPVKIESRYVMDPSPIPKFDNPKMHRSAGCVVTGLDEFRRPADDTETETRRAAGLSARQEELLREWGYPYVLDEFRFHMTLSGRQDPDEVPMVQAMLAQWIGPILAEPLIIERLAIMGEAKDGRFRLITWLPLGSGG